MDPRTVRTRQHVLEVALGVLREQGSHALAFSPLAERAQVSRQTLYRYWVTPERLLIDVLLLSKTGRAQPTALEVRSPSVLHAQVVTFLRSLRDSLADPGAQAAITAVMAAATHDEDSSRALADLTAARRAAFVTFYGEIDQAQFGAIVAPVFFAQLIARRPADDAALAAAADYAVALHLDAGTVQAGAPGPESR